MDILQSSQKQFDMMMDEARKKLFISSMPYTIEKGWGREVVFADQPGYCGKIMHFDKKGNKFSLHYHAVKDETWVVLKGSFLLTIIDTVDAKKIYRVLNEGDTWRNPPNLPHQLEAMEDESQIIEVSTADDPIDNYRVEPGDSQKSESDNHA